MTTRKVDILFEKLGGPGKFQVIAYICLVCNLILTESNFLSMAFFAARTEHHCKLGSGESVDDFVPVISNNENEKLLDGCRVYANNATVTIPCKNGWTYHLEEKEVTIISEFNLVCGDAYKAELSGTIFFAGVTLGTFVLGYFADKWGRRPMLAIMLLSTGGFGLACFFAKNYVTFTVFRFLLGFTTVGIVNTNFVLGQELFQTKYRTMSGISFALGSTTGGAVLAFVAYLLGDWRYIQLVLSILPFIQFCMLWFVPESIRWLLTKRKFERAEAVIKRVVVFNNLPFPREIFDEIKRELNSVKQPDGSQTVRKHKAGYLDLVKNRTLRNRTIILFTCWFSVMISYFGLAYSISSLFGNKYLNFGISQVLEIFTVLLITWITSRFGRRGPIAWGFFVCGVATIITLVTKVVKSDAKGLKVLGTITAVLGKAAASSSLTILFAFTTELFPTVIRNISLGVTNVGGRTGAMAAPQILLVGVYTSDFVPYSIIGGFALLSGFLIFLLPKTHNKPLMDTIEHTNEFVNYHKEIVELEPESTLDESYKPESIVVENHNAMRHENIGNHESMQLGKPDGLEGTLFGKLGKPEATPIETDNQESIVVGNPNAIRHENLNKPESTEVRKLDEPESKPVKNLRKPDSTLEN